MATMISEVYDALKDAGASEEKARAAAEILASYDDRFSRIEGTLRLHSWMLTAILGIGLMILLRVW